MTIYKVRTAIDDGRTAIRMVGPGGTVDSSLRVFFCLLTSKFCMSCKTSRNFGNDLERSFAYSDSFMNMNSSSLGKLVTKSNKNQQNQQKRRLF